jgi:hypothetical protein
MLGSLPVEAIRALIDAVGPEAGSSLLAAELRQLGGQLGRAHPDAGVLPRLEGQYVLFGVAMAITPQVAAQGSADAARLVEAMRPWSNGRQYLNFAESAIDTATGYAAADFERLRAVRAVVDPDGLFVANHRVDAATADVVVPEQR